MVRISPKTSSNCICLYFLAAEDVQIQEHEADDRQDDDFNLKAHGYKNNQLTPAMPSAIRMIHLDLRPASQALIIGEL